MFSTSECSTHTFVVQVAVKLEYCLMNSIAQIDCLHSLCTAYKQICLQRKIPVDFAALKDGARKLFDNSTTRHWPTMSLGLLILKPVSRPVANNTGTGTVPFHQLLQQNRLFYTFLNKSVNVKLTSQWSFVIKSTVDVPTL